MNRNSRKSLLAPGGPDRSQQIQDARDMCENIERNAKRSGTPMPPYDFIELIGKGAFGRVYKCRQKKTGQLVAVKILSIDDADFAADPRERDETVKDFRKEVETLRQLKDYRAKNVNLIHDAFDLHSQLWIVSDYCTGGSVRTLMRANPQQGLEDKYLIPIARELAIAMKSVHDLGVIHRDIKCANVYVTEDGRIQLGDFGVVGVMDNGVAKRTTIIGTPWYMPLEMHTDDFSVQEGYGKEVDVWAYGCTIYEMATGSAPNANVMQNMLGMVLEQQAPRLEGDRYSDSLRNFVTFCLNSDPAARPSADDILRHPYVAGSEQRYPTQSLVALIDRYIVWEHRGGVRASLFNPGGAAAPVRPDSSSESEESEEDDDDWTFNTTDSFYGGFQKRYSQMVGDDLDLEFEAPAGAGLPPALPTMPAKYLTPAERIQREHAAKSADRGERSLERIFNQEATYDINVPTIQEPISDLPLREYSSDSAPRESTLFIDLDTGPSYEDSAPSFSFDFDDVPTVKAKQRSIVIDDDEEDLADNDILNTAREDKRSTMAWQFPKLDPPAVEQKRATMEWAWPGEQAAIPLDPDAALDLPVSQGDDGLPAGFRPQLKHTVTAPIGQFNDFIHAGPTHAADQVHKSKASLQSLIDLSFDLAPADIPRPSTAGSYTGSVSTVMTSGPFDLDDERDEQDTDQNRISYHKAWQSEGGENRGSLRAMPLHLRGASLSSTDSELERVSMGARHAASELDLRRFHDQMPPALNKGPAPQSDGSSWLLVDDDETTSSIPNTPSQMSDFTFPSTNTSFSTRAPPSANIISHQYDVLDFPKPIPPSEESLIENASTYSIMAEVSRLLSDTSDAFKNTALAMDLHFAHDFQPTNMDQADTARPIDSTNSNGVEKDIN